MDEHVLVWGGSTVTFDADFSDENLNDIGFFTEKHNRYATREAIEIIDRRLGILSRASTGSEFTKSRKTRIKHWVRDQPAEQAALHVHCARLLRVAIRVPARLPRRTHGPHLPLPAGLLVPLSRGREGRGTDAVDRPSLRQAGDRGPNCPA